MKPLYSPPNAEDRTDLPLVAVVGRTNVGKSTLYNRLCGGRAAIVEDKPGLTRDRRYGVVQWENREFRLVDTGGLEPDARLGIAAGITRQAHLALSEAVLVIFVLDAQLGPTPGDKQIAQALRKLGNPVLWVANKVDTAKHEEQVGSLYELGGQEVLGVSAEHGRGIGQLLDRVVSQVNAPVVQADATAVEPIRLAFVGKPNAGKSSLVNALLGEDRVLVDDVPGTTMDPVDTPFSYADRKWILVDTAGIRKHRASYDQSEFVAVTMAKRALERADVAVLVIDSLVGASEQDARIANLIEESGRAAVVVLNKVDRLAKRDVEAGRVKVSEELAFLAWADIVTTSALTGANVPLLLEAVTRAVEQHRHRVPTAELNRVFEGVMARHPPPGWRGQTIKLYYITQVDVRPPTFVVQANKPEGINVSYRRFLAKMIREEFDFRGTPIRLLIRPRSRRNTSGDDER